MQLVANQRTDNDAFSMLDESDRAQNVAALAFGASQLKKIENKWCSLCRTKLTGKFLIFRHAGQSFDFSFTDARKLISLVHVAGCQLINRLSMTL